MTRHWIPAPTLPADRSPAADACARSGAARHLAGLLAAIAPCPAPILLQGPSGAGKEVAAAEIHRLSGRGGAFVAVNCAAIPADLLEAELFGAEKGAYTGADRARPGLIAQAEGGTLFLDEIGDMPLALQAKLLRVLESRTIRRLGSGQSLAVDFRLVAATHRDLPALVAEGGFREDIYHRIAVFPVAVPALKDRIEDLPGLVALFLRDDGPRAGMAAPPRFTEAALAALAAHDWPGNIRELRSVVMRAAVLFAGRTVGAREVRDNLLTFRMRQPETAGTCGEAALPAAPEPGSVAARIAAGAPIDLRRELQAVEIAAIRAGLVQSGGSVTGAAAMLGLQRTTLIEKMRKLGIGRG